MPPPPTFEEFFKQFAEFVKKDPVKPDDPLKSFVEEHTGKIPSCLSWDRAAVVKEPHFWLLMFDAKINSKSLTESDFKDEYGGPGRLLTAWSLRATAL